MNRLSARYKTSERSWLLLLAASACCIAGCKTPRSDSQLQHEFGETQVPKTAAACATIPDEHEADTQRYAVAREYVAKLAAFIVEHPENRQTFAGPYQLGGFCFSIKQDPMENASGNANGRITFWTGRILRAKNDTDLASTLSHELAHVTMQHGERTIAVFKAYASDFVAMNSHIASTETQFKGMLETARAECQTSSCVETLQKLSDLLPLRPASFGNGGFSSSLQELEGLWGDTPNAQALLLDLREKWDEGAVLKERWLKSMKEHLSLARRHELEADEVGFEIYLRAGFKKEAYASKHLAEGQITASDPETATATCLARLAEQGENAGSFDTHPSGCFRALNINIDEMQKHRDHYKDYVNEGFDGNLIESPSLAEAIADIKNNSVKP